MHLTRRGHFTNFRSVFGGPLHQEPHVEVMLDMSHKLHPVKLYSNRLSGDTVA